MTRASRSQTFKAPEFRARAPGFGARTASTEEPSTRPAARARPTWRVVIADLSEARIYAADSGVSQLKLLATVRNPSARKLEQDLLTGRAGSKFNRSGGNYQALAPTSRVHRERNEQFGKAVAAVAGREIGNRERLALVAAPRLLALIGRALPRRARTQLACSVPRDVTHESAARLRIRLQREPTQVAGLR